MQTHPTGNIGQQVVEQPRNSVPSRGNAWLDARACKPRPTDTDKHERMYSTFVACDARGGGRKGEREMSTAYPHLPAAQQHFDIITPRTDTRHTFLTSTVAHTYQQSK